MRICVFKYASTILLYAGALLSFFSTDFIVWLLLIYAWLLIPLLELLLKPDEYKPIDGRRIAGLK